MPNKRIHPVNSDAAMGHNYPNQYEMLEKGNPYPYPQPPYPNPHSYQHPPKNRSATLCCLRCLCCCYCCLLVIVFVLASVLLYMVRLYLPQVPTYEIQSFTTNKFQIQSDHSTLDAEFVVTVKADNPNGKLGFTYGEGSSIEVKYHDMTLCSGTFPSFQQEPFNETIVKIDLKGLSHFDSDLQEAFMGERNHQRIGLIVRVRVPMSVQGEGYSTFELVVGGICTLVVDSLDPKKESEIVAHSCAPFIGL